ncbi:MAG TPA: EamA family transporter [Thermoanaerobaculia bacterium]|jgi:drug/metabolite transporter (DMT)-like permease
MSVIPLLILLAASLASSGFDLFRKVLVRHLAPVPMVVLLALASVPLFAVMVALQGGIRVASGYWAPALASVVLNTVANLTFLQSVRISPLSVTVPLLSLTPAFTTLLGLLLLGERPAPLVLLGIALVVVGAFWLNLAPGGSEEAAGTGGQAPSFWRLALRQPGSWLMAATALLMSCTIPLDKLAVARATPPFHGLILTTGIAVGTLAVLLVQGRTGELAGVRQGWLPFFLALTTSTLALAFQLAALKFLLVGVIETVKRGVGNLMAVLLGRAVFGEPLSLRKLWAAAVMAAGVGLILL